jgi:Alpha/beta hydrolase domain
MAVSHFEITRRADFPFDYERIDGSLHFEVDPTHAANARIVDLDLAPRNAGGRVEFRADFLLLRPRQARNANRKLLAYVVNRGQRFGVPFNRVPSRAATLPPTDDIDVGDGFLMRRGWTVAMCGWQWDVERQPGLMGLDAPQALGPDGQPQVGQVSVAFQPNEAHAYHLLSHWPLHPPPGKLKLAHKPYPAADVNEADAKLTVRDSTYGSDRVIPRAEWRFAREEQGRPVEDDRYVWLRGGFLPGRWYQVTYTTRIAPVVGSGLLATRDSVSWLRHGDSPVRDDIDFAYGYGISQCGRFLRQFIYDGLNVDENGRQVFDGLIPHVAGARRGEFNVRYGQPSETNPRGVGGLPPFTGDELLQRQRQLGGVPRVFTTNTSSEYWRSDCSLIHTDPAGSRDVEPPAEERIYLVAGHQHGVETVPLQDVTAAGARGANRFNVVDGNPAIRAFLINLDRWCSEGLEPPPSRFPRLADGTAVPRDSILAHARDVPGWVLPDASALPALRDAAGTPYTTYAPAVDADGNEVVGIRMPEVSEPLGTHTGWVPRHPETGAPGQVVDMMGTTLPFAQTAAERQANGDPRPSVSERYASREAYLERVRSAAEALAAQRYLVAEDVEVAVDIAARHYDLLVAQVGVPA